MFVNCLDAAAIIDVSQLPHGVVQLQRFRLLRRQVIQALHKLQALVRLVRLPLAPHTNLCLLLLDSHTPYPQAGRPQILLTTTLFPRRAVKEVVHLPLRLPPLRRRPRVLEAGHIEAVRAQEVHLCRTLWLRPQLALLAGL